MTQSWLYRPMNGETLIGQFGVMPQVSWSISTEWFFYMVYPAIYFVVARLRGVRVIVTTLILFILVVITGLVICGASRDAIDDRAVAIWGEIASYQTHAGQSFIMWLFYFSPFSRITEFILGVLVAALYLDVADRPVSRAEARFGAWAMALAVIALTALYGIIYVVGVSLHWLLLLMMVMGFAPFLGVIIFCAARYRNSLVSFLSLPRMMLCGEASYSLYLLHLEMIYAFRWTVSPILWPSIGVANTMRWAMLSLATIGLSLVTWQIIEMPARRWLRKVLTLPVVRAEGQSVAIAPPF